MLSSCYYVFFAPVIINRLIFKSKKKMKKVIVKFGGLVPTYWTGIAGASYTCHQSEALHMSEEEAQAIIKRLGSGFIKEVINP